MSKEKVVNIYGLMDAEMDRMHSLMSKTIDVAVRYPEMSNDLVRATWARITELQAILTNEFKGSDKGIQDAVAELALTSKE
jgi:hypothetical protein